MSTCLKYTTFLRFISSTIRIHLVSTSRHKTLPLPSMEIFTTHNQTDIFKKPLIIIDNLYSPFCSYLTSILFSNHLLLTHLLYILKDLGLSIYSHDLAYIVLMMVPMYVHISILNTCLTLLHHQLTLLW